MTRLQQARFSILVLSGLAVLAPQIATAQMTPPRDPVAVAQTTPQLDSRAVDLLRQMSQTLQAFPAFAFQAEIMTDALSDTGQKIQYAGNLDVWVDRSRGLWAELDGDRANRSFWYDGRSMTLYDQLQNTYATVPAPDDMDEALDYATDQFSISLPLIDLVYSDPYAVLTENVQTGNYLGMHRVGDELCHHLAFTQRTVDWQIWISDTPQALPCKVVITYKKRSASPQFTAILTRWDLRTMSGTHSFTFRPPSGATEIDFLP